MMTQRLLSIALAGVSLLALCGCPPRADEEPTQSIGFRAPVRNRPQPTPSTNLPPELAAEPTPRERRPAVEPPPTDVKPVDYPYGVPVPGKPELVTSPYAPDSGYVNIQGYTPGQEVRCPYTQKIFLVP